MTKPLFPLLKLPYLGQKLVIKLMSIDEQLRYSTISRNTSLFLKNLHLKVDFITLRITNEFISIIMNTSSHIYHHLAPSSYSEKKHQKPRLFLDIPVTVFGGDESILRKPEWSLRDWRDYLVKTYNCKKFKLKVLSCDFHDIETVLALFKGLNVIGIAIHDSNQENGRKILELFPPKQELALEHNPFEGFFELVNLNLNYLKLGYSIPVTVHNLMRMKSKNIEIRICKMNTVELNRFIKRWIKMETNLELETMSLVLSRCGIDRNQVLNEIAHFVVEPNKIIVTEYPTTLWEELELPKAQYEIRREDGKKATIQWFEPGFVIEKWIEGSLSPRLEIFTALVADSILSLESVQRDLVALPFNDRYLYLPEERPQQRPLYRMPGDLDLWMNSEQCVYDIQRADGKMATVEKDWVTPPDTNRVKFIVKE